MKPIWFWPQEDRLLVAEREARFDKLYEAYVLEKNRRAGLGQPPMTEPPAVDFARQELNAAKASLRTAKKRPRQIATALRWGGAVSCLFGLMLLGFTRSRREVASPSPDA